MDHIKLLACNIYGINNVLIRRLIFTDEKTRISKDVYDKIRDLSMEILKNIIYPVLKNRDGLHKLFNKSDLEKIDEPLNNQEIYDNIKMPKITFTRLVCEIVQNANKPENLDYSVNNEGIERLKCVWIDKILIKINQANKNKNELGRCTLMAVDFE